MVNGKKSIVGSVLAVAVICAFCAGCNPKELPFVRDNVKKFDEYTTKETDDAIKKSPELQELDALCKQIPLSDRFEFYSKRMASHGPPALFFFYSSEEDFLASDALFKDYFKQRGWEIRDSNSLNKISEFRNEKYLITIQYGGIGKNANYAMSCEKLPSRQ